MSEKYITVDLEDERTEEIADVISNKTCKKILNLLADGEMSESDISNKLKIPLNTVGYNMKKLVNTGLIEKVNRSFWSSKGKKINIYKIANKKIVISPKSAFRGILPAILLSGAFAFGIKVWSDMNVKSNVLQTATESAKVATDNSGSGVAITAPQVDGFVRSYDYLNVNTPEIWAWFLLGALFALLIVLLWNWRRK